MAKVFYPISQCWRGVLAGAAVLFMALACRAEERPHPIQSPLNQVFQFVQTATCAAWTTGTPTTATGYLWIPEECQRVRGLLVLCANVPEHRLVGHELIRRVCAQNDLAIFWGTKSFYNFQAKNESATAVAFLQQLLDGLAQTSGYDEIASVPWLPMGESGHLLMVDALLETAPERCIAGIYIKNNHLPPKNRTVPALVAFGTAQEWSQDKSDIRAKWNDIGGAYAGILNERARHPEWPLSYIIDGSSGHFDCSEPLASYFAHYIDLVAKARLAPDGKLRPVAIEDGYLADMPVPGHEDKPIARCGDTPADQRAVLWYFDSEGAKEAQTFARINWKAETQLVAFADEHGEVFPYTFNGITLIPINKLPSPAPALPTPVVETEADGITFSIHPVLLDKIPQNFAAAGEPLARAPGKLELEWLCGCVEPLGGDKFRMALDRTWPSPIYIAARQAGTADIRAVVQPAQITRDNHSEGAPQKIIFGQIPDVAAGTKSILLDAKADSGLPIKFFTIVGPAVIKENTLVFTKIPPRTKYPVTVTVAAWQWGRSAEPKVKTAEIVKQTFHILAP